MRTRTLFAVIVFFGLFQCSAQTPDYTEVAPGIALPNGGDGTVYALDNAASGPVLQHILPHEATLSSHAGSNVLRGLVYSGPHMGTELDGLHAPTSLSSTKAVLYVRLAGEEAELMRSRVHLLWLQPGKKRREISDFSMNVFGGQRTRNVDEVPCDTEMIEGTNWLKITPKEPLLPGEFGIVFLPRDVNHLPTLVFDFAVAGAKIATDNPYVPKSSTNSDAKKP